jgi:predicted nucleic acid-binding protein
MRFWDSSAIIPLLVTETQTRVVSDIYADRSGMLVWWVTEVECASAIARREREGSLPSTHAGRALERLDLLKDEWHELQPSERVRTIGRRLLRVHSLRAGDALQLAAAVLASEGDASSLEMVTLDDRLSEAAHKEGFRLTPQA